MKKLFIETTLEKIDDFFKISKELIPNFVFRGQRNYKWKLETSLERALINNPELNTKRFELAMINNFIKKRHLYETTNIDRNDLTEILAELQHHGAPTRLLDFSKSIYIAGYFATKDADETPSSIWSINKEINPNFNKINNKETLNKELNSKTIDIASEYAILVESDRLNIRMARQQGVFLTKIMSVKMGAGNAKIISLEECILSSLINEKNTKDLEEIKFGDLSIIKNIKEEVNLIKINIPPGLSKEIFTHLDYMGINEENLFPGLDGLSSSIFSRTLNEILTGLIPENEKSKNVMLRVPSWALKNQT